MRELPSQPSPHVPNVNAGLPLEVLTERMRGSAPHAEPIALDHLVESVLISMNGRLSPNESNLLREIAGLGRIIEQAKIGVAEISVDAIRGSHIPSAAVELDAIVQHTASATNSILECCETLDALLPSLDPAHAMAVQNVTTTIYEACGFQDITGQRVTKVVKALQAIEAKVVELSKAYALSDVPDGPGFVQSKAVRASDPESLLNGPALTHEAMDQSDIDRLLADF